MSLALIPRMSEKSYAQSVSANTYIFVVPMTANSGMIKTEVEKQFKGVKVKDVRTIVSKGKAKRSFTKRNRLTGRRSDFKKAYVSLSEGKINIFGEEKAKQDKAAAQQEANAGVKADTKSSGRIRSALGRKPRTVQNKGGDQ